MNRHQAHHYRRTIENAAALQSDEKALDNIYLYPKWVDQMGKTVNTGERYVDNDKLWKVLQNHTAMENWRPEDSPSLYVEVTIEEWPEWVQPVGSTDAYPLGAKVTHNGHRWESTVDNNTWEPGIYGWLDLGEI